MSLIRGVFNCVQTRRGSPEVEALPEAERPMLLLFRCPGCRQRHGPTVGSELGGGERWGFNGDYEKPVFSPSLLVWWPEYSPSAQAFSRAFHEKHGRYPTRDEDPPNAWDQKRCHSHIGCNGAQPGEIIFLSDCTHELANKTVPLQPYPSE